MGRPQRSSTGGLARIRGRGQFLGRVGGFRCSGGNVGVEVREAEAGLKRKVKLLVSENRTGVEGEGEGGRQSRWVRKAVGGCRLFSGEAPRRGRTSESRRKWQRNANPPPSTPLRDCRDARPLTLPLLPCSLHFGLPRIGTRRRPARRAPPLAAFFCN